MKHITLLIIFVIVTLVSTVSLIQSNMQNDDATSYLTTIRSSSIADLGKFIVVKANWNNGDIDDGASYLTTTRSSSIADPRQILSKLQQWFIGSESRTRIAGMRTDIYSAKTSTSTSLVPTNNGNIVQDITVTTWTSTPSSPTLLAAVLAAWIGDGKSQSLNAENQTRQTLGEAGTNAVAFEDVDSSWTLDDYDLIQSLAWGDVDVDGDLGLAVGNKFAPNKVYLNEDSKSQLMLNWLGDLGDLDCVAWGDVDGDGDLDAVVANRLATVGRWTIIVWLNDDQESFNDRNQRLGNFWSEAIV